MDISLTHTYVYVHDHEEIGSFGFYTSFLVVVSSGEECQKNSFSAAAPAFSLLPIFVSIPVSTMPALIFSIFLSHLSLSLPSTLLLCYSVDP